MAVQLPTPSQLLDVASEVGLDLTDADLTSFIELMRPYGILELARTGRIALVRGMPGGGDVL